MWALRATLALSMYQSQSHGRRKVRETKGWDLVMICILLPILSFRGSPSWQLTHKGFSFRVSAIMFTSVGTSWFMAWGLSFISDCGLGGPLEST